MVMLSFSFILNQTSVKFISFKNGFACIEFVFCVKIVKNAIVENHSSSNYQQILVLIVQPIISIKPLFSQKTTTN